MKRPIIQIRLLSWALSFASCSTPLITDAPYIITISPNDDINEENSAIAFSIQDIFLLESNDLTLLGAGKISIVDYSSDHITVNDNDKLCIFNTISGKCTTLINHKGSSGEEYLNISDAFLNNSTKQIAILCGNSKKIIHYDLNGKFINSIKNDSISSIELYNNLIYTHNNPFNQFSHYRFGVYDSNWTYVTGIEPIERNDFQKKDLNQIFDVNIYNNTAYLYKDNLLSKIENHKLKSHIYLDKGKYTIPDEIMYDIKRKKERYNYIWGDYSYVVGDYLFYRYYYENNMYSEVYSIKNDKLLYRNIASSPNENNGFPIYMSGQYLYVWPTYVKNDSIFIVLDEMQMENTGMADNKLVILVLKCNKTNNSIQKLEKTFAAMFLRETLHAKVTLTY